MSRGSGIGFLWGYGGWGLVGIEFGGWGGGAGVGCGAGFVGLRGGVGFSGLRGRAESLDGRGETVPQRLKPRGLWWADWHD